MPKALPSVDRFRSARRLCGLSLTPFSVIIEGKATTIRPERKNRSLSCGLTATIKSVHANHPEGGGSATYLVKEADEHNYRDSPRGD